MTHYAMDTKQYVIECLAKLIANRLDEADLFFDPAPDAFETDPRKAAIDIITKALDEVLVTKDNA